MTAPPTKFRPKQIETRFLYPFFFNRESAGAAADALLKAAIQGREGNPINVWECCEPPALYKEELLDHVNRFLFQSEGRGCRYLRVSGPASNKWFNKLQAILREPKLSPALYSVQAVHGAGDPQPLVWPISLTPVTGIEVFLTNYGVGLLSIALTPEQVELDVETTTLFNYKLSQLRPQVSAKLRVRHASDNQSSWNQMTAEQKDKISPVPPEYAPLTERLGVAGGIFRLGELVTDVLLDPLTSLRLSPFQNQFSVYTVVRFGEEVDFDRAEISKALASFLSGISQIEEPQHAGSPVGTAGTTSAVLNRRHSAAVGLLGMAHIVSDQPAQHSFNEHRVPRVLTKYFVPYLAALLQRVSIQRSIREASDFVLNRREETAAGLSQLRRHMLEFAVEGYFPEISHREVLDRHYRMVQEGLGIRRAFDDVSRSIADIDAQFTADHQAKLSEAMADNVAATRELQENTAKMQDKVSLLERFIVSVYAAELWHLLASEIYRWHHWIPHGVVFFAILGFTAAWAVDKYWNPHSKMERSPTPGKLK